jgi:deoxyadenosine/deoxycytidine kinase
MLQPGVFCADIPGAVELRQRYIVVEGPIGVGKTSLTRALSKRFGARSVFELVEENPFLASFYQDRNKHAFQTQLFFLLSRFKQQQELFQQDLFSQVTVSDYLFAKDRIFASITLDPNELALYERVYEHLGPRVMKPDLVIYLQARLDVLLARIRKRGREFERKFDPEYLAELARTYNDFFHRYEETPLLVINTSDIDFVESEKDFEELIRAIGSIRAGTHYYQPLGTRV